MMRIALIGPLPPPSGGMANLTLQLNELLCKEGLEVEIVQTNAAYRPSWVGKIRGVRAVFRLIPYFVRLWKTLGKVQVVHLMANSGWSWHLYAAPAILTGRLRNLPVIVNYHGGYAREFLMRHSTLVRLLMRQTAKLIVPSGFLHKIFADYGMSSTIVPNVVDLDIFSHRGRSPCMPPEILVARNLEPVYDNATAIRALRLVHEKGFQARLVIAGSGPEAERLRNTAIGLGVEGSVEFTGRVSRQEMPRLYSRAAIVLNPSLADNAPGSVLEALSAGVPVVSTNVGGVPYILEHEKNALLVQAGDAEAMANAIVRILSDTELSSALVNAGGKTAKACAWPVVRESLLKIYVEALDNKAEGKFR